MSGQTVRNGLFRSPLAVVGGGIVALLLVVAVLAPVIAPYDPSATTGESYANPSRAHLLGTNAAGQDLFSQLIWGSRASMTIAIAAAALTVTIGVLVGAGVALRGGRGEFAVMRGIDVLLALPMLPVLIVIATLAGRTPAVIVFVIAVLGWPAVARTVRSQTLSLRQRGFVASARGFGASPLYILRRHIVPGLAPIVVASFVNWAGAAIFIQAGLAFLGLGDPLGVSWGQTLNDGTNYQGVYYSSLWAWWILPAGFAITLAVLGFTLLGIGLEPIFNPRLRKVR